MYTEITEFKHWNDLEVFLDSLDSKWIFRGQQEYVWPLSSTMDRLILPFDLKQNKRIIENSMLRELSRKIHLYNSGSSIPLSSDLQRISFMQHYGAPSRLIDFSYSPYVALFFALENSQTDSALFAFHTWDLLRDIAQLEERPKNSAFNLSEPDLFSNIMLNDNQKKCVGMVQPFLLFDRINSQSGCFLCQGDINFSFEENLVTNSNLRREDRFPFYKIQISKTLRSHCIDKLHRMNITRATLFPDLEGFVKSISMKVIIDVQRHYSLPDTNTAANSTYPKGGLSSSFEY